METDFRVIDIGNRQAVIDKKQWKRNEHAEKLGDSSVIVRIVYPLEYAGCYAVCNQVSVYSQEWRLVEST